jgi:hypothetical protein
MERSSLGMIVNGDACDNAPNRQTDKQERRTVACSPRKNEFVPLPASLLLEQVFEQGSCLARGQIRMVLEKKIGRWEAGGGDLVSQPCT